MQYFEPKDIAAFKSQHFAFLIVEEKDHVLTIILDRAEKKNALHPQMINELAYCFQYAYDTPDIWVVTIGAKGNVFCAGADLKAMSGMAAEHDSTIPQPQGEMLVAQLFKQVCKPTIAKVTGDVYAGGFFFLSGCNIVIAQNNLKFGLPEVKRGLYPFQVMASLLDVMPARKVLDWCIRGYNLPVEEAERFGLVTQVASAEEVDKITETIIEELKSNSPTAIHHGLKAYDHIRPSGVEQKYLMSMLMQTIASQDGQEGLKAFREKRKPVWTGL